MADGRYKIEWPTGVVAFTDDFHLAVCIAKAFAEEQIDVTVYEKTGADWLHVYPQ